MRSVLLVLALVAVPPYCAAASPSRLILHSNVPNIEVAPGDGWVEVKSEQTSRYYSRHFRSKQNESLDIYAFTKLPGLSARTKKILARTSSDILTADAQGILQALEQEFDIGEVETLLPSSRADAERHLKSKSSTLFEKASIESLSTGKALAGYRFDVRRECDNEKMRRVDLDCYSVVIPAKEPRIYRIDLSTRSKGDSGDRSRAWLSANLQNVELRP